jgi:hypothetical protein
MNSYLDDDQDDNEEKKAQRFNELLAREGREKKRLDTRPDLGHLADAVAESVDSLGNKKVTFLAKVGDRVVVERHSSLFKTHPWIDTRVWCVNRINAETGRLDLWCDDLWQNASCNYIEDRKIGYRFKLVPLKGSIFKRKKREDGDADEDVNPEGA